MNDFFDNDMDPDYFFEQDGEDCGESSFDDPDGLKAESDFDNVEPDNENDFPDAFWIGASLGMGYEFGLDERSRKNRKKKK